MQKQIYLVFRPDLYSLYFDTDNDFQLMVLRETKLSDISQVIQIDEIEIKDGTGDYKVIGSYVTNFNEFPSFYHLQMINPSTYRFKRSRTVLKNGMTLVIDGPEISLCSHTKKQLFDYTAEILKVDPTIIATILDYPSHEWLRLEIDSNNDCKIYQLPSNIKES